MLKLYAWDEAFQQRLQGIRDQELHYVRKAAIYFSGTAISFSCSTVMVGTTVESLSFKIYHVIFVTTFSDMNCTIKLGNERI